MNKQPQKVYTGLATVEGDGTVQIGSEPPQEWTPERIRKIADNNPTLWAEAVARELNKLNAALAAEREKLTDADEHYVRNVELLRKQLADADIEYEQKLAAERSKLQAQERRVMDEIQLFEQQLAAEQKKRELESAIRMQNFGLTEEGIKLQEALVEVTKQRDDFRRALEERIHEADALWLKLKSIS